MLADALVAAGVVSVAAGLSFGSLCRYTLTPLAVASATVVLGIALILWGLSI